MDSVTQELEKRTTEYQKMCEINKKYWTELVALQEENAELKRQLAERSITAPAVETSKVVPKKKGGGKKKASLCRGLSLTK